MQCAELRRQFEEYMLYELERKQSTIDQYRHRIDAIEKLLGKEVQDITADDLRWFKRESTWKKETTKSHLVAVRQFHLWGVLEGHWEQGPIALVRMPRVSDSETTPPLPIEQACRLLEACQRPLEYRLVYYPLYGGTRIGESAAMHGSMWQDGWLRFRGEKNDRWREIPIHPELERVKWELFASRPTDKATLQRVKRRLAERTGIKFVSHQLRKTFSSTIYDDGTPDRVVKELLGHAQDVTGLYVDVSRRRKQDAVLPLDYWARLRELQQLSA